MHGVQGVQGVHGKTHVEMCIGTVRYVRTVRYGMQQWSSDTTKNHSRGPITVCRVCRVCRVIKRMSKCI